MLPPKEASTGELIAVLNAPCPSWALPTGEICTEALRLACANGPRGEAWRQAFHVGAREPSAETIETYRVMKAALPDVVAVAVESAIADYREDLRIGVVPSAHRVDLYLEMDLEGRVPAKGTPRLGVRLDHAWVSIPGVDGPATAVVLQHELIRLGSPPPTTLDIALAGMAWAGVHDLDRMRLGRCYHAPGKPPVYKWTDIIDERAMTTYWARIHRTFARECSAVVGEQCERCEVRRSCRAWLLPVLETGPEALRSLVRRGGLAANDVPRVRWVVNAMREAVTVAEGQLRSFERGQGAA